MIDLVHIKSELDKRRGKLELINQSIDSLNDELQKLNDTLRVSKEAQKIIQIVAKETQQQIEYHISNMITMCIQNLGKDYQFVCEFVTRRDKTECDLYLTNDSGEKLDPYAEVGGSIVQIIDFALRCSLWSLQKNKVNNFLFLDEPFNAIRKNLHTKLKKILSDISQKLKLQLVIISHDPDIISLGDNVINLEKKSGKVIVSDEEY